MGKAFLLVALIALVIYALLRLWEKGKAARSPRPLQPRQAPRTRRVVAPDDDAEFLRDLEQKRRRQKRGEQSKGKPNGPQGEPDNS